MANKKENSNEATDIVVKDDGTVTMTTERLMALIDERVQQAKSSTVKHNAISSYDVRDPQKIESVNVRQFDGMFVLGFKNHQKNLYKKNPQYTYYGVIPGKGNKEPFLTLILSNDGVNKVEKDVSTTDYMHNRDTFIAKVLEVKKETITQDHGVLGQGGQFAGAVDEKYKAEARPTHLMQSQIDKMSFVVQLPGFANTTEIEADFLA